MRYYMKSKLFKIKEDFWVTDGSGNKCFFVDKEFFTFGLQFKVEQNNMIRYRVREKLFKFLPSYEVFNENNDLIARVRKNFTFFRDSIEVESKYGDFQIEGDFFDFNYRIIAGGRVIAEINKEILAFTDNYYVDINYDNYVANEIAMFNSLFSYANDELCKNNNKYSNLNSDGLDYGMLNLSGIRLNTINLNDNVITRLLSEKIRIQKEISKINDMITIYNSNLDIVILKKNIKAIEKISELLKSEFEKLDVLQSLYTATENSLSFAQTYYNNNVNCLTNEAIITGIRNSIAHGNYNIVNDDDKIKIVFNDKVNNKLVFSCEVFINDFRDILINSAAVVKSFIDNKYNDKNIVKVKSLVIV